MYLIHMHKKETIVNRKSTACHGINLVLDLDQNKLNVLAWGAILG